MARRYPSALTDMEAELGPEDLGPPDYGLEPDFPPVPIYKPPAAIEAPPLSFADRLALAFANTPQAQARPFESPVSAGARGLVSGLASGYSTSRRAGMERGEQGRKAENEARQKAADRQYQVALDSWRARLRGKYGSTMDRNDRVLVTPQMASDFGLPSEAAGTYVDPLRLKRPSPTEAPEAREARIGRESFVRGREAARGRASVETGGKGEGGVKPLRWTPTSLPSIRAAESELSAARKAVLAGEADEAAVGAVEARLDDLRKRDFAAQMRGAKSRREAETLAEKALNLFPEWGQSPMIRKVAADKLDEFSARKTGR